MLLQSVDNVTYRMNRRFELVNKGCKTQRLEFKTSFLVVVLLFFFFLRNLSSELGE